MKTQKNINLLLMLLSLISIGQMTQTIYVPSIKDIAKELKVCEEAIQNIMAAYLLTYGTSQLVYGPLSDRIGRKPVILAGMLIFIIATIIAILTHSIEILIIASILQGAGTGVGGVMARTLPSDLHHGVKLRYTNSLLNMGVIISPLIAPLLGGILNNIWSWRACYIFLLILCSVVTFSIAFWMPETYPIRSLPIKLLTSYSILLNNSTFNCYLLMLVGGLAGISVFEVCSGILLSVGLGLNSMIVSILFILPIPAIFFGAWFAGRPNKSFSILMWQSVSICCLASIMMLTPGIFGIMSIWTLIIPAIIFFFGAGMLFPLATSGAMEPFPLFAGTAGALVGGFQNIGSSILAWLATMMSQTGQFSLGLLMTLMSILILACWLKLTIYK